MDGLLDFLMLIDQQWHMFKNDINAINYTMFQSFYTHMHTGHYFETLPPGRSYAELNVYDRHYPCLVCKIYKSSQFAAVVKSHFLHRWDFVCEPGRWNWFPRCLCVRWFTLSTDLSPQQSKKNMLSKEHYIEIINTGMRFVIGTTMQRCQQMFYYFFKFWMRHQCLQHLSITAAVN